MLLNEPYNCIQLHPAEATGTLQGNGFQPEFCNHVLTPDVNVGRLAPIQRHEEEAIGTYPENRRHAIAILSPRVEISTGRPFPCPLVGLTLRVGCERRGELERRAARQLHRLLETAQ